MCTFELDIFKDLKIFNDSKSTFERLIKHLTTKYKTIGALFKNSSRLFNRFKINPILKIFYLSRNRFGLIDLFYYAIINENIIAITNI